MDVEVLGAVVKVEHAHGILGTVRRGQESALAIFGHDDVLCAVEVPSRALEV